MEDKQTNISHTENKQSNIPHTEDKLSNIPHMEDELTRIPQAEDKVANIPHEENELTVEITVKKGANIIAEKKIREDDSRMTEITGITSFILCPQIAILEDRNSAQIKDMGCFISIENVNDTPKEKTKEHVDVPQGRKKEDPGVFLSLSLSLSLSSFYHTICS